MATSPLLNKEEAPRQPTGFKLQGIRWTFWMTQPPSSTLLNKTSRQLALLATLTTAPYPVPSCDVAAKTPEILKLNSLHSKHPRPQGQTCEKPCVQPIPTLLPSNTVNCVCAPEALLLGCPPHEELSHESKVFKVILGIS